MKRMLTITLEFDDSPWLDEDEGKEYATDAIAYAMDQVNTCVEQAFVDFVDAKLDGTLLVDARGYASDDVKERTVQHSRFLRAIEQKE